MSDLSEPMRHALDIGTARVIGRLQDAIEAGTLDAKIVCVITDVENAGILQRAAKHGGSAHYVAPV